MQSRRCLTLARRGAAALGVGIVGIVMAAPALAATDVAINTPATGTTYSADQPVSVDGEVSADGDPGGTAAFMATAPDYGDSGIPDSGCVFQVGATANYGSFLGSTEVSGTLDLGAAYPMSCGAAMQGKPAVNGSWNLVLSTSTGASAQRMFTTAVPPLAPTGVRATSPSPLTVAMTWARNPELDTHAYAVLNASGDVVSGPLDAADACSATSCTSSFPVGQGGDQSFRIRAYRYSAPGQPAVDDLKTDSAGSAVTVQAGPVDSPAPTTPASAGGGASSPSAGRSPGAHASSPVKRSGGAGSSPSAGGTTLSVTASEVDKAEALKISKQFHDFAAPAGIDKLPPLPKLDATTGAVADLPAVATDDGEPTDQGTFKLSLGYAPETKVVATRTTVASAPLSSVANAVGISATALWQSLAGSLVLLLCAGHVRRWARQSID